MWLVRGGRGNEPVWSRVEVGIETIRTYNTNCQSENETAFEGGKRGKGKEMDNGWRRTGHREGGEVVRHQEPSSGRVSLGQMAP